MRNTASWRLLLASTVAALALGSSSAAVARFRGAQDTGTPPDMDPAVLVLTQDDLPDWAPDPLHIRDYGYHGREFDHGQLLFTSYDSGFLVRGAMNILSLAYVYPSVDAAASAFADEGNPDSTTQLVAIPPDLADDVIGIRRMFPTSQNAGVELRLQNVIVSASISAPNDAAPSDDRLVGLATTLAQRAQTGLADAPTFNWEQVVSGTLRPWLVLLSATDVGGGWTETHSGWGAGGDIYGLATKVVLSAYRRLEGPGDMAVTSHVVVLADAPGATRELHSWVGVFGTQGDFQVPKLGDETSTLKLTSSDGTRVEYRVKFRRGTVVDEVDAEGPVAAAPQPEQVIKWAQQADTKLSAAR